MHVLKKYHDFYKNNPLLVILVIACILRLAAAWYNYTPTAEDDYANIIAPALKHYQTGAPIVIEPYRLPILPKIFYGFLALLKPLGISDTRILVSWGLTWLGLLSLIGVWGFYKLSENFLPSKYAQAGGWLFAAHFILPFYNTRAFQECLTLITVPFALYFITKFYKHRNAQNSLGQELTPYNNFVTLFLGGFLIGLTVIFRFQAGLLAITFLAILIMQMFQKRLSWKSIAGYVTGGLVSFILLISLDLMENRSILSTPLEYFQIGYDGSIASDSYGSAPWYTYITLLAAIFIPPISIVLLIPFIKMLPKNYLLSLPLFVFVLAHSFIGNKLERFMLPILPIFLVLTLQGILLLENNKIVKFGYRIFWILNLLLLIPVTFSRSQLNIIDAANHLRTSNAPIILYKIDLWKQAYMTYAKPDPPNFTNAENLVKHLTIGKFSTVKVLSLGNFSEMEYARIKEIGYACKKEAEFHPSWQEKIVIKLNPKFNSRRDTSVLYHCSKSA